MKLVCGFWEGAGIYGIHFQMLNIPKNTVMHVVIWQKQQKINLFVFLVLKNKPAFHLFKKITCGFYW